VQGDGGDSAALRDENADLKAEIQELQSENDAQAELSNEVQKSKDDLRAEQTKVLALDKKINDLNDELVKAEQERDQFKQQALAADTKFSSVKAEGRLGMRAQNEQLADLRSKDEQIRNQEDDLQTLIRHVQLQEEENNTLRGRLDTEVATKEDLEQDGERFKEKISALNEEIRRYKLDLQSADEVEAQMEAMIDKKLSKQMDEMRAKDEQLRIKQNEIDELSRELVNLKDKTAITDMEKKLGRVTDQHRLLATLMDEEKAKCAQAEEDLRTMAEHCKQWEESEGQHITLARADEQAKTRKVEDKLVAAQRQLKEKELLLNEMENEKGELQDELQDAVMENERLAQHHNMEDGVRYIKKLKDELKQASVTIKTSNTELDERIDACNILFQTCQRLKKKCKLPPTFEYEELELRQEMRGESARYQSLCNQLEHEIDTLEQERLRLLKALRASAQTAMSGADGSGGLPLFNLSPEHLMLLHEYAEELRKEEAGLGTATRGDRSFNLRQSYQRARGMGIDQPGYGGQGGGDGELFNENAALRQQLADAQAQVAMAQGDGDDDSDSKRKNKKNRKKGKNDDDDEGSGLSELRSMLKGMITENAELKQEMKLVNEQLMHGHPGGRTGIVGESSVSSSRHGSPRGGRRHLSGTSSPLTPKIDKRMLEMQDRLTEHLKESMATLQDGASGANTEEQMKRMREEYERVVSVVDEYKEQVFDARRRELELEDENRQLLQQMNQGGRMGGGGLESPARSFIGGGNLNMSMGGATSAPKSPGGQKLLRQEAEKLSSLPESWKAEVTSLNAQLVQCLEELGEREDEVAYYAEVVTRYEESARKIAEQQTMLYKEHIKEDAEAKRTAKMLEEKLEASEHLKQQLQIKVDRFEQMTAVLDGNTDRPDGNTVGGLREHVKSLSRSVAVYEVNQCKLARRYNLLEARCQAEHTRAERAEDGLMELDEMLRPRLLQLELWKRGAKERVERSQAMLEMSVPESEFKNKCAELKLVDEKYKRLLAREMELETEYSKLVSQPRQIQTLTKENQALQLRCVAVQEESRVTKTEVEALKQNLLTKGEAEEAMEQDAAKARIAQSKKQIEELVMQIAQYRGEAAGLEVEAAGARKNVEMQASRADKAEAELEDQRRQLQVHREQAAAERKQLEELQEQARAAIAQYEGGMVGKQAQMARERINYLEQQYHGMSRDLDKYRGRAEIAQNQLQFWRQRKGNERKEVEALTEKLQILEERDDDSAIIGKLQHKYMEAKLAVQSMEQRHAALMKDARKTSSLSRKQELQITENEDRLQQWRETGRTRVLTVESALRELQSLGVGVVPNAFNKQDAVAAGVDNLHELQGKINGLSIGTSVVTVNHLEMLSKKMADLSDNSIKVEAELERSEEVRMGLEQQLDEAELEVGQLRSQCDDLKRTTTMDSDGETRVMARRLVELSEKLKTAELDTLRQRRELTILREENDHVKKVVVRNEGTIRALEQGVVDTNAQLQAQYRAAEERQDSDAKQRQLQRAQGEGGGALVVHTGDDDAYNNPGGIWADEDAKATAAITRLETPTRASPVITPSARNSRQGTFGVAAGGGAAVIAEMEQMSQLVRTQNAKLHQQEKAMSAMQSEARTLVQRVEAAEGQRQELVKQVEHQARQLVAEGLGGYIIRPAVGMSGGAPMSPSRRSFGGSYTQTGLGVPGTPAHARAAQLYENETTKLQKAAQATIGSLKEILAEKTDLIEELQDKVRNLQLMRVKEKEVDQAEIERLSERLYRENADAIGQLRSAVQNLDNAPSNMLVPVALNKEMEEQLEEAQHILAERDQAIDKLKQERKKLRNERDVAEVRAGNQLAQVDRLREQCALLTAQLEVEKEEQTEDQADVSQLVTELRGQLAEKEKKMGLLRQAVVKLKQEFVEEEERKEEEDMRRKQSERRKTDGLTKDKSDEEDRLREQVDMLKGRLRDQKEGVQDDKGLVLRLKKDNRKLMAENERLSAFGDEAPELHSKQHEAEVRRMRKNLEEAHVREAQLQERVEKLASKGNRTGTARVADLEKRLQVLQAQNDALRSAGGGDDDGDGGGGMFARPRTSPASPASSNAGSVRSRGGEEKGRSRVAWEREKNLAKKVETLRGRLEEKVRELEVANGQCEQAKNLMGQVKKEKMDVQRRLSNWEKTGRAGKEEVEQTQRLRDEVFQTREENDRLRLQARQARDEGSADLQHQLRQMQLAKAEAVDEVEELRARLREMQRREVGRGGGHAQSLRASEERFMEQESQLEDSKSLRKQLREQEARMLESDAELMSLRYELEAVKLERSRLRERMEQLQKYRATMESGQVADGPPAGKRGRGAGERFQKERDLEGVVDALKRVVDKQKSELERLRKTARTSTRNVEQSKKLDVSGSARPGTPFAYCFRSSPPPFSRNPSPFTPLFYAHPSYPRSCRVSSRRPWSRTAC
jgi:hypothetical protein